MLGNTPTVARKSYIHRRLIARFEEGTLAQLFTEERVRHLSRGEAAVARLFAAR
jgi:DNA topoisomerase-1